MERVFPPTRYDKAPFKQIDCVKDEEGAGIECYIQLNPDEEHPEWVIIGDFLHRAFAHRLDDESFIDECLERYHGH